jgi:membrane protease YdiL (CAAX protease family)
MSCAYPRDGVTSAEPSFEPSPPLGSDAPPPRPSPRDGLPAWPAWAPFAAMLVTVVATVFVVSVIGFGIEVAGGHVTAGDPPPGVQIGGTFAQDLLLIAFALVFARVTAGMPRPVQFGLVRPRLGRAAGQLALTWLAFLIFSYVWAIIVNTDKTDDLPQELGADKSTLALVAVAVLVCVMAPIAEELFFRGFCFTALRRWLGLVPGALLTGLIFGGIHAGSADVVFLPPLAFLGMALCVLYYRTGSLLPCMVLHAFNNALALGVSQNWDFPAVIALMAGSAAVVLAIVLPFTRSAPAPVGA